MSRKGGHLFFQTLEPLTPLKANEGTERLPQCVQWHQRFSGSVVHSSGTGGLRQVLGPAEIVSQL